ncbi:MAG: carboxypeptidase-like regulatory domain-containing protein [bacterium]
MRPTMSRALFVLLASSAALAPVRAQQAFAVRGTVYDSMARHSLAGAVVQVARIAGDSTPRITTTRTDDAGRYRIDGLREGRYAIGFQHEALNTLGLESPLRAFELGADSTVRVDLAIESGAAIRRLRCGKDSGGVSDGMLVGIVEHATRETPAVGAHVLVRWVETALQRTGFRAEPHETVVTADDEGRYLACGVPSDAVVDVVARQPGYRDVTGQVNIALGGALRQDFLLADSGTTHGAAAITGRVLTQDSSALASGVLSVDALAIDTPIKDGAFSLGGIPAGTWFIELKAIGYEPRTLLVNATAEASAPLRLVIEKKPQTLEAINVIGAASADTRALGRIIDRGRRSTGTVFLPGNSWLATSAYPADVLRAAPGFHYKDPYHVEGRLGCKSVAVYLDGLRMVDLEQATNAAPMNRVLAIEAYPDADSAPLEFRSDNFGHGCAVVAIWTRH